MKAKPLVSIIMGSDSDLPIMEKASEILHGFKIPHEITVVSAHRTPKRMFQFAESAEKRGIKIIIAGAGGAAHLPGMIASITPLPVIGVPVNSKNSIIGVDSLLSIVQMPGGVPVATVGIDNAKNAGLLATRILATTDKKIKKLLDAYIDSQTQAVMEKVKKMEKQ